MPVRAMSACSRPGCSGLSPRGGRCPQCRQAAQRQQDARRGTPHERYGPGWAAMRARVLAEEDRCWICGGAGSPDDVADHVLPASQGGTSERDNVRRAHYRCNARKAAREGWNKERGQLRSA